MFENLGFTELLLIFVIALVIFGPQKLPQLGKSLGSALREFRKAARDITEEITRAASLDEPAQTAPAWRPAGGPPAEAGQEGSNRPGSGRERQDQA